jgi:hypothetical protein
MKYDIFAGANEVKYHGTLRFDNFSQAEEYAHLLAKKECKETNDDPQWFVEEAEEAEEAEERD